MAGKSAIDLVLTITAADLASGILKRFQDRLAGSKGASKELQQQLDRMNRSLNAGVKAVAIAGYLGAKLKPGVSAAADLQEAMKEVERNTAGSVSNVQELHRLLTGVKKSAIEISATTPFSAQSVVGIENSLIKAGVPVSSVTGRRGAASASAALSAVSNTPTDVIGDSMAKLGSQFGLLGSQYYDAANWIARVDNASATNVPTILEGLEYSGASAHALGISLKDSVTALGTLAPLGEKAGASLNEFLTNLQKQNFAFKGLGKDRHFIGLPASIEEMRKIIAQMPDEQQRLVRLQEAFGQRGARAANTFLTASTTFQDIQKGADQTIDLLDAMKITLSGFNQSAKSAGGALRTMAAITFTPLLAPLTSITSAVRDKAVAGSLYLQQHTGVADALTGTAALGIGGLGLYGISKLLRGGVAGMKAWRLRGGVAGTLAGVAEGKVLQATAGVTPVFVTNWPGGAGAAIPGAAGGIAETVAGGAIASRFGTLGRLAGKGFGLAAAWEIGQAVGSIVNKTLFSGSPNRDAAANSMGHDIAEFLALFGNKEAQSAINSMNMVQSRQAFKTDHTLHIKIDAEGRPRLLQMPQDGSGIDFNIYSGLTFNGVTG